MLTRTDASNLLAGSVSFGSLQAFSMHQHTDCSTGLCHIGPILQQRMRTRHKPRSTPHKLQHAHTTKITCVPARLTQTMCNIACRRSNTPSMAGQRSTYVSQFLRPQSTAHVVNRSFNLTGSKSNTAQVQFKAVAGARKRKCNSSGRIRPPLDASRCCVQSSAVMCRVRLPALAAHLHLRCHLKHWR